MGWSMAGACPSPPLSLDCVEWVYQISGGDQKLGPRAGGTGGAFLSDPRGVGQHVECRPCSFRLQRSKTERACSGVGWVGDKPLRRGTLFANIFGASLSPYASSHTSSEGIWTLLAPSQKVLGGRSGLPTCK